MIDRKNFAPAALVLTLTLILCNYLIVYLISRTLPSAARRHKYISSSLAPVWNRVVPVGGDLPIASGAQTSRQRYVGWWRWAVSCGAERARAPDRHAVHAILVPNLGLLKTKVIILWSFRPPHVCLRILRFLLLKNYADDVLTPTF